MVPHELVVVVVGMWLRSGGWGGGGMVVTEVVTEKW